MKRAARATALGVLSACRKSGAWADGALKTAMARDGLSGPDAALCTRIVYGVVQNEQLLDYYLAAYCAQSPQKMEPVLRDILLIGAYQILYLDRVPDSAAVNESVELAKAYGKGRAGGLVNAVLRKLSQNKERLPRINGGDEAGTLALTYSHPRWLAERLLALLGREETEAFLRENNGAPPLTVQVNPLKTTAEELCGDLEAAGVQVRMHPWLDGCLELAGTGDLTALASFREGKFLVQDSAARLVSLAAGVKPGQKVIDTCAAPGGKSFAAAMEMGDTGEVLSCDIHPHKLKLLESGAERLGICCVQTLLADGRQRREELVDWADTVIVDAPCSGLGIIRKKPDIRRKKPEELSGLPAVQGAILDNASAYVKPGGVLLYSTCTILPEENEAVIEGFLSRNPHFTREGFCLPGPVGETTGELTFWPQRHGTDGFYICRMKRKHV